MQTRLCPLGTTANPMDFSSPRNRALRSARCCFIAFAEALPLEPGQRCAGSQVGGLWGPPFSCKPPHAAGVSKKMGCAGHTFIHFKGMIILAECHPGTIHQKPHCQTPTTTYTSINLPKSRSCAVSGVPKREIWASADHRSSTVYRPPRGGSKTSFFGY